MTCVVDREAQKSAEAVDDDVVAAFEGVDAVSGVEATALWASTWTDAA
jgi:hypothetical protein